MKTMMMRIFVLTVVAVTATAPSVSLGGDAAFARGASEAARLDLRTGTRIANGAERITYSPRWGNAAECSAAVDGNRLLANVTDEGTFTWTPSGVGAHTLTHTAGATTYTAQFTVLGDDTIAIDGNRLLSNATWTADKTWLITTALTVPSGVSLTIAPGAVVKFMPGTSLTVESGGSCTAKGVVFTHVNDDTIGGDTLMDGDGPQPVMGDYTITGNVTDDDATEYRYMPPQTLTSSISSNTRLRGYRTYIVSNSVTVASGATLTLQPGTILKFNTGCSLTVNGTLDAQGTRAAPIVFTSLKDDAHGGDTNGDGEKTYAQAGDWYQIRVAGTANFNYCSILYNSSTENYGGLEAYGGTVTLDNSEVAHCKYECVNAHSSGKLTARNTAFWDGSLGFGYYGGSNVKAYNCVFHGLTTAIRQSGKQLVNCIFSECISFTDQGGDGSTYKNCCFFNPTGYGAQSYSKTGTNGNIWGDPFFVDALNGDFRIAANSPCVDAGDGTVAPETDYYGQPRMDVKRVKDTGKPNGDGVCPDIGIYEVPGAAAVPLPDLAVVSVAINRDPPAGGSQLAATVGDTLTVTYVVTNRGAAAMTGILRDTVNFKAHDAALGEQTIPAAEIQQAYNVPTGGCVTLTATVTVPTLKAGKWKVLVAVNVDNYPYEQNLSNNSATGEDEVTVELEAMGLGTQSVTVEKGETAGFVLSGLPLSGGVVRVTGATGAVAAYGGNGAVPTLGGSRPVATVSLADGSLLIVFPARAEGENAYLVLENGGSAAATVSVEVKETELALYGATPARIANSGEATITITGSGLSDIASVTLGGRVAKSVEALNAAQIAATFDVEGMAAGTYGVTVEERSRGSAPLPNAVEVYAAKTGAKLRAWLEMPSSVRDGRVFTGYVCYANEGDSPMTMPVFKVAREDSNTKLGLVASESMTETKLYVGGISPTHPAGVLKAGDEARIPFYFQPFGTYRIKLSHIKDAEDLVAYPTFGGTKAYLAAMGAAATRLNLRGRTAYDIHDFVDQALWEKNGVACAAASGHLVDAKTGEPLANADISLVGTGDSTNLPPATATTDENGYFQLTNLADGEYRWLLDGGNTLSDASTNTVTVAGQSDLNGLSVSATPGGRITGFVLGADGSAVSLAPISLECPSGEIIESQADNYGAYSFAGLANGEYSVAARSIDGFVGAIETNVFITTYDRHVNVNFELRKGCTIYGRVLSGEIGVSNVTVRAISSDGNFVVTHSDGDGMYSFEGLPVGVYRIDGYSNECICDVLPEVELGAGEKVQQDLTASERAVFMPIRRIGVGRLETKFLLTEPSRKEKIESYAWDFNSDGVIDSLEAEPEWTYDVLGTFDVTLVFVENGETKTSVYAGCISVEEELPTQYQDNAIVFGVNAGSLAVVGLGENTIRLAGEADIPIAVGCTIAGKLGEEWFARKITAVTGNASSGWNLTTAPAQITDIFKSLSYAGYSSCELGAAEFDNPQSIVKNAARKLMGAKGAEQSNKVNLTVDGGVELTVDTTPDLGFEFVTRIKDGKFYAKFALVGSVSQTYIIDTHITMGVEYKREWSLPVNNWKTPIPGPIPMTIQPDIEQSIAIRAQGKFAGRTEASLRFMVQAGVEIENGKAKPLPGIDFEPHADSRYELEGSLSLTATLSPGFKYRICEVISFVVALEASLGVTATAPVASPPSVDVTARLGVRLEANLLDLTDVKKLSFGVFSFMPKFGITERLGFSYEIASWKGADPDFRMSPNGGEAPLTVDFLDNSKGEAIKILTIRTTNPVKEYKWDIDGYKAETPNVRRVFDKEGTYPVSLWVSGGHLRGPYRKKATLTVGKPEEIPDDPNGDEETDDDYSDTGKQSWDPNEMVGEPGVGEARCVKPGQELTYTIYFENKEGFDIADAQDVKVTNPLSEWLDWSTFEMGEVAFNNQNDVSLDGLAKGERDIKMNGTNKYVRVSVGGGRDGEGAVATQGVVHWRMRVYDPNGLLGWPNDGSGFLPSNDDTHRGEGHITYRIKVRDDAPANVVITNSASIVFDYNDPIETDPAWWNTVAGVANVAMEVGGVETNLSLIVGEPFGELPEPGARDGYTFGGWYTQPEGQGMRITPTAIVPEGLTGIYAYWIPDEPAKTGPTQPWTAKKAVTLDGAVYDADGKVAGVVQLKVAKPNAKKRNAKVSGAVTLLDGKKRTLKAAAFNVPADKPISASLSVKGLGTLSVSIGDDGFEGSVGAYTVAAAKVGGRWTRTDARVYAATGSALPPGTAEAFLPDGEPVRAKGGKWAFDKAASIKYAKGVLSGDTDPKKPNLSAMKLAYTPKTGLFKGSFKLYALQGGKLKKYTVKVTGVVVDGEGTGVGKLAKPAATWSVSVR